jgi:hypothetical protein
MIILIVYQLHILPDETKNDAPVTVDTHRPECGLLPLQRMQPKGWNIEIVRNRRGMQSPQHTVELIGLRRLDAAFGPGPEKRFKPGMTEADDHMQHYKLYRCKIQEF